MTLTLTVCMKPVWQTGLPLRSRAEAGAPHPDDALYTANPADLSALALALALRAGQAGPCRVRAFSLAGTPEGLEPAREVLRQALALGADEARLFTWAEAAAGRVCQPWGDAGAATLPAALALGGWLAAEGDAGLVLAGEWSADTGRECFGALLAGRLGWAFAHRVVAAQGDAAAPGNGPGWRLEVLLERGYRQEIHLQAPAVCTVSAQVPPPPEAPLPAWVRARQAEIPTTGLPWVTAGAGTQVRLRRPHPPVQPQRLPPAGTPAEARIQAMLHSEGGREGRVVTGGNAQEQAAEIARFLAARGYWPGEEQ